MMSSLFLLLYYSLESHWILYANSHSLYRSEGLLLLLVFFHRTPQKLKIAILPSGKAGDNFFDYLRKKISYQSSNIHPYFGNSQFHSQSSLLLQKGLGASENRRNESNPELHLSLSIKAASTDYPLGSCCGFFRGERQNTSVCGRRGNWASCWAPFLLLPVTAFAPMQLTRSG